MPYADPEVRKKFKQKYFQDNIVKYRLKRRRDVNAKRDYVAKLKDNPCMDCGGRFPSVAMDFDHREGETKERGVAAAVSHGGWERLKAEIARCDLVCANCHRVRTQKRLLL